MHQEFSTYAAELYQRCDTLARFSQSDMVIDRRYLSEQHQSVNLHLARWMTQAGMQTWQDQAGNQWGQYSAPEPNAPVLIFGSHIDSVPAAGKYDGVLGVLLPISLLQYFHDNQLTYPFHIRVVAFGDEEGSRFGTTLLGSRAVAGKWQPEYANLQDENGISLRQAFEAFSLDIEKVSNASVKDANLLGFIEFHIEQGPVLESNHQPAGVVTGIAGAERFRIEVAGMAGHAGTVPMAMRRDALSAAAEMVLAIESLALHHQLVATVGKLNVAPGAVNVIAGQASFSLDVRSVDDYRRQQAVADITKQLQDIAVKRGVRINIAQTHQANAVTCHSHLQELISKAILSSGIEPHSLPSGAGHDAMVMAEICPIGMVFLRCVAGISHHPDEAIYQEDLPVALAIGASLCQELAASSRKY